MELDFSTLRERPAQAILLLAFFCISLLHSFLFHFYVLFVFPVVISYFFTPYLAEFVFLLHRRIFFKIRIKARSNRFYYRFLISNITLPKIVEYSFYPFLFFLSILLQTAEPTLDYLLGMKAFFTTLSFPFIFLLSSVMWVLDQSGLRYVDEKNQYIERIGNWFGTKFRGFASFFVVISLTFKLLQQEPSLSLLKEILTIGGAVYLQVLLATFVYLKFGMRRDLEKFESILVKKYEMEPERVEFSLKKTPFYFKPY